ncbi:hypothetical protein GW17_00038266 [Ensete ventricosum]|nr:hypothetical protein GW17_00038266 [Ensete ventricosum]RZR78218.1 hypothetical protein BHM03_00003494 [Ensete ventricosum]
MLRKLREETRSAELFSASISVGVRASERSATPWPWVGAAAAERQCSSYRISNPEEDCKYFIPKSISDNQLADSKDSLSNADSSVDGSDHYSNPGHGIELEQLGNNGAVTGLHMLNLSKNKISIIEGLRELTRLRGNKISEIEGLHRLLKLSVLDVCSNRISNSKGLKQLAANYASLRAVNIKSNPAEKNVGDEELKKHLSSLLPHLAYYNKQAIRANGSKEVLDHPRRSFSSHQFDRSFRSEGKDSHRGIHGTGLSKSSYSHGKSGNGLNTSVKSSKRSHRPLKSVWPKPTNHLPDVGRNMLLGLQPSNFLRRTQSEGAFGESYELLSYRLDPLVPVPDMEAI